MFCIFEIQARFKLTNRTVLFIINVKLAPCGVGKSELFTSLYIFYIYRHCLLRMNVERRSNRFTRSKRLVITDETRENLVSEDKSLNCRYLYKVPFTPTPFSERGTNGQVKVTRFAEYRGICEHHSHANLNCYSNSSANSRQDQAGS